MPFALIIGLFGSLSTTILSMMLSATGVWFGGWVDDLIQRLTEVNLVLPILMISVLAYAYLGISIWTIFIIAILLNVFGATLKSFRSVLLQIREAPYIEAARAYGAISFRIIVKYMVPRVVPVVVLQLIILIPSFVFLEAIPGLFNINTGLPTWGTVIYQTVSRGALYGSHYWVLVHLVLLFLAGFAFSLCGSTLEKIPNLRLLDESMPLTERSTDHIIELMYYSVIETCPGGSFAGKHEQQAFHLCLSFLFTFFAFAYIIFLSN